MDGGGLDSEDEPTVGEAAQGVAVCASPDTELHVAAELMASRSAASIVVCDDQRPVGIVSERDLVRFLGEVLRGDAAVVGSISDLMTSPVLTVTAGDTIADVAEVMQRHRIRSLPVVDDAGRITGLVRFTDVLAATVDELESQRDQLEEAVQSRTAQLQDANTALRLLAREDSLMGIGNRRAMEQALESLQAQAVRHRRPYAVILADVDNFKLYNDQYGHPAGDEVLRAVGRTFRDGLRAMDKAFRYGGEEILAVLPDTSTAGALIVAERLRAAISALRVEHEGSETGFVSLSLGVSAWGESSREDSWEVIVSTADQALYQAKEQGRDRVRCLTAAIRTPDHQPA